MACSGQPCDYIYIDKVGKIMFAPNLRRSSLNPSPNSITLDKTTKTSSTRNFPDHPTLVPEAFFEASRATFIRANDRPVQGLLNTASYPYPKQIEEQFKQGQFGDILMKEGIFCLAKENNIWFWRYTSPDFSTAHQIFHRQFSCPITAVDWSFVDQDGFFPSNFLMITIAFGCKISLFRIKEFEEGKFSGMPQLIDLKVSIISFDIVSSIKIVHQRSPLGLRRQNALMILWGDDFGKLNLFDFQAKKKIQSHSNLLYLMRPFRNTKVYFQIKEILVIREFCVCLVEKTYPASSVLDYICEYIGFSRNSNEVIVEQTIDVYQIKLHNEDSRREFYSQRNATLCSGRIVGLDRHKSMTVHQIINKIKSSYHGYFQKSALGQTKQHLVDSMVVSDQYIELVFKSGDSIRLNENLAFVESPTQAQTRPTQIGILETVGGMRPGQEEEILHETMLKSRGQSIQVYSDFIVSRNKAFSYLTPFNAGDITIRKIVDYHPSSFDVYSPNSEATQFIVFGNKEIVQVQQMDPQKILFLLSLGCVNGIEPGSKFTPQKSNLQAKIKTIVDVFGATEMILWALELLTKSKIQSSYSLNLRTDIYSLVCQELSTNRSRSFREAKAHFDSQSNGLFHNKVVRMTGDIEQFVWGMIFHIEHIRVKTPSFYSLGANEVDAIYLAFQIMIGELFSPIRNWAAKSFCMNRQRIYYILTYSKIIRQLLQKYSLKQQEILSQKFSEVLNTIVPFKTWTGLKANFCTLCDETLQKLNLLLEVYDYLCESDLSEDHLPTFSELLFNSSIQNRIRFSTTILNTLALNNQNLIDNLSEKIPELQICSVRNFKSWLEFNNLSLNQNCEKEANTTTDSVWEEDFEQVYQYLNPFFYEQIERVFLKKTPLSPENRQAYLIKLTALFRLNCRKSRELFQQVVKVSNLIDNYRKDTDNYYGILELPGLLSKRKELTQQEKFFTQKSNDLVQQLFTLFTQRILQREDVSSFLQASFNETSSEIRRQLDKTLDLHKLRDLLQFSSRRQMLLGRKKPSAVHREGNNRDQLVSQSLHKYV